MTRPLVLLALLSVLFSGCTTMSTPGATSRANDGASALRTTLENQGQLIEDLRMRVDSLEQRLADQQNQLGALQAAMAAQKVTYGGENTASPASSPATEGKPENASATEIYLKAFGNYASGRYNQAIEGFDSFLRYFPTNNYAGNAQFWLGECYYKLGSYDRAVQEYQKVVDNYPLSGKAPDALLRMAPALRQLNQYEKARQALQTLQQRYPDSTAAHKAVVEP